MFREYIAQGNAMFRRLEAETGLSESERRALPGDRRVPVKEAMAWQKALEEQIRGEFGADSFERYRLIWTLHSEEVDRGRQDEIARVITAWRRNVTYLGELVDRHNENLQMPDLLMVRKTRPQVRSLAEALATSPTLADRLAARSKEAIPSLVENILHSHHSTDGFLWNSTF